MSRHGTTNFTDCTAVRHESLNKSVSTHGNGLSDVAYSKHFYTLVYILVYTSSPYARLVLVNWTFHVSIWLRTGDGHLPTPVPHLGTLSTWQSHGH